MLKRSTYKVEQLAKTEPGGANSYRMVFEGTLQQCQNFTRRAMDGQACRVVKTRVLAEQDGVIEDDHEWAMHRVVTLRDVADVLASHFPEIEWGQ